MDWTCNHAVMTAESQEEMDTKAAKELPPEQAIANDIILLQVCLLVKK